MIGKLSLIVFIINILIYFGNDDLLAQNPVIEKIVEELADKSSEEDQDYSSIIDDLNQFIENPLNINEANVESLEKLHFLPEFQIENILNYLAIHGEMKTIYELQLIDGMDIETIKKMLPFIKLSKLKQEDRLPLNEMLKYGNQKFTAETKFLLQTQKGYLPSNPEDTLADHSPKYLGNKMKYLFRYRFNYKSKIYAGVLAEKDPGEKMYLGKQQYGFDFYTFHFQANDLGKIKTMLFGDYEVNFGQGLIIRSGYRLGKSSDAINIRKKGQTLRYYSSTDENTFLRGGAATISYGKFDLTGFVSHKNIDASLVDTTVIPTDEEGISGFQNSGYHRTETELKNRKAIGETIFGGKIGIGLNNFRAGLNFIAYQLEFAPIPSGKPYKLFDLNENSNFNSSVDYTFFAHKFNIFGETALSKNGGIATLNGMVTKILPQVSISVLHRYYQENYQAYYANAFSENSKVMNEHGIYYGIVFHPIRKLRISAYADGYAFPWLKYGVDAPSGGTEYLAESYYLINRNTDMYFRWKSEKRGNSAPEWNKALSPVTDEKKDNYRFHINYQVSSLIGLRSRVEYVLYQKDGNKQSGFMIMQDLNINLSSVPLTVNLRYAMFDAPYEARIYAYENDLLYSSSIPAYSGNGSRFYVMFKYKLAEKLDIRFRLSQFRYIDAETVGSGLDEIEGNKKTEVKLQLVLRL